MQPVQYMPFLRIHDYASHTSQIIDRSHVDLTTFELLNRLYIEKEIHPLKIDLIRSKLYFVGLDATHQ